MSQYISQYINVARWQDKVRSMFGIDGENPVPTLDDLLPVAVIENDRLDTHFPGREFHFMGRGFIGAGGAANPGVIAFLNPTGSGVLATIDVFSPQGTAGLETDITGITEASVLAAYAQIAGFTAGNPTDSRAFGQAAACQLWTRNNAVPPGGVSYRLNNRDAQKPRFVVHPGLGFIFSDRTLNEQYDVSFWWSERALESGTKS